MNEKQRYQVIFTTERGHRHQQGALAAAPQILDVVMLRQPDLDTLLSHLANADYFISERAGAIDANMIASAPNLKLILRLGSTIHDIDLEAAQAAGIRVCYWPVSTVIYVAEHMVMQMLALSKKLHESEGIALAASSEWAESKRTDEDTFAYNWSGRKNVKGLWQRTVGILGLGEIGVELARRLLSWNCTLIYHKRRRLPKHVEADLGLSYVDRDTLLAQSDFVANLLPYFPNTDMLLDAANIAKMKQGAFIVSCGSGSVIDEHALAEAIMSHKLGGAALDTFEWEPIKADNPLIGLARDNYNVLLTPHIAAGTTSAARQQRVGDYTNIMNDIEGAPLRYRVV
jgi:phosphoglycerate dehydrogenase-like enzyme